MTADHLVTSRADHDLALVGPVPGDQSWQARRRTGYEVARFTIDWERRHATCPRGKTSVIWKPMTDSGGHPHADCSPCPARRQCISHDRPRALMVRAHPQFDALLAARHRQTTDAFKARYAKQAGIEGTIAQGVRRCDLRRTRFVGLAKTALSHVFIATALNLIRVAAWLAEVPRSVTRRSAFARLAPVRV